jgi:two-component system CheB/CheR fusion protein
MQLMANNQFIVAIGASAGGLEALTTFFEYTLSDGVSYIVIPHLSADVKSSLLEILSRHTKLEICEATQGMEVLPNKVYLIPNTEYMGISAGRLFMIEKEGQARPHLTIDAFFISLATERGPKAIAVVLSGVGTDGSRGAIAIQEAGGLVIIQEPTDAKYDGMPTSAIGTGVSNYILNAKAIPMAIQQYVHDYRDDVVRVRQPLSQKFLNNVVDLIKTQHPFDFTDYKLPTIIRRIGRRMDQHKIADERKFFTYIQENPEEAELLIADLLIGVTSFFRDPAAFEILETRVIPPLVEQISGNDYLKIWVACCATGEEAYSLAILVREYLIKSSREIDVKIFATDINQQALEKAGKGLFPSSIDKSVSNDRLERFFDKVDGMYKVKPEIRKMLIFARHDLTRNPPYCDVDLISCRNMLMYIKPEVQKQILAKLGFGLRKGGFLFLGSSENLTVGKDDYLEISSHWKIYQSLKNNRRLNLGGSMSAPISNLPIKHAEKILPPRRRDFLQSNNQGMNEVILMESGYCGLSVDEEGNVTHAFGDLSPFLKSERFKFNLKELLPDTLDLAFSASLVKVLKTNQRVRMNHIDFTMPNSQKIGRVDLIVSPFIDGRSKTRGFLVLFKPSDVTSDKMDQGENFNVNTQTQAYIAGLEEEVYQLRQELIASNDVLESSRETMQAYNEELLSANEEMQSANEELQSINEELETINREHQYSIDKLSELNDDLNNYFRSNMNGQLIVDRDILLKKYSPGAIKHINIRDSDLGRPLSNITTNIKFNTLIDDIRKVIDNDDIVIKEVESTDGKIYQVMTSPYLKTTDNKIDGAIITFYDISELKRIQTELDKTNKMLTLATVAAEIGTWSIDVNTRELVSSPRLTALFGFNPENLFTFEEVLTKVVPEHRAILLDTINSAISLAEKFELEFPLLGMQEGNVRWLSAIGNLTYNKDGAPEYLTGIMYDVTDHKLDDMRKNDFIAIVSHELKTPLTSLTGYIQVLLGQAQKCDDAFAASLLEKANNQVKKMTTLINGFLNLSRLEAGKIYLNKEDFDIDLLIKEIVDEVATTTSSLNIVFLPCKPLLVNADREKIGQVINNIINNAVKYAPRGLKIEVVCTVAANNVQISVKDEGIGIKPEDQLRLFDRYFRIETENSKTVPGFGIGLYLSSEIIKQHNGQIWVESEVGKGSTFCFTLPLS